ncbi:hypothetical protein, conserved, partial [Babesia bigemina]
MSGHGVTLDTLKECFEFLEWLNGGQGQKNNVVNAFMTKLRPYYGSNSQFKKQLQNRYVNFVKNVASLHKKLSSQQVSRRGTYKVTPRDANQILDALLECTPKFLAALSFIQYHVDATFRDVGGGDWALQSPKSRDFQEFLTTGNNIIRGGFDAMELGNVKGGTLVEDLKTILNKYGARGNPVHDHFRNVILTTLGKSLDAVNTGNAVFLLPVFCELVIGDPDGNKYKSSVEKAIGTNTICWTDLKDHCQLLKEHIDQLTAAGFSATGIAFKPKEPVKFVTKAAEWCKANLSKAAGELGKMIPPSIRSTAELQSYAKDKLYPNGFIFDGSKPRVWAKSSNLNKWDPIFQKFVQLDETLRTLKEILEGTYNKSCTAPSSPKPQPSHVKVPEAPKEVVPEKKVPASPGTEAVKPVVTKAEAAKPTATKTEATKTEAAKPQAKNAGGSTDQNTSQSGAKPGTSSVGTPSSPHPGGTGAPGPPGTGTTKSSPPKDTVQKQQSPSPPQPALPPAVSPPGAPAAAGSPGKPGSGGGSTKGGGDAGQKAAASPAPKPQTPSDTSSRPQSSVVPAPDGVPSTGSGQGLPGAVQPGGNGRGKDTQGGGLKTQQPAGSPPTAHPQTPNVQSAGSPSPGVPAPGGGSGTSGTGSTSGATQQSGPTTSQNSTVATTTTSAGPGTGAGGGAGGGGSSNSQTQAQCPSHMRSERKGTETYCHPSVTLTRRPDFKVSNPDEVWNAIQSKTLPSYITTAANNHTTTQYKTVSTSVNHPNHTTQGSFQHPTDGRNRHAKPYYVPADGRPRKGVMGIRDVPSLDFDGESIPDKSLKRVQQEMRRNGELGKKRVAVKVRAKHDQALRDVQDRWNKDAEKIKTEDKEWRKRQEAGKLLKQSDDYAIVQQERKRAAAEALQKKLDDHRIAQEEELKKIQSAPSVDLDGSQPIYQYPYVINNHQDDFLSMYSVDGGVIPDPYKDQNDSERKRKSDDALHDILTEKQLQLALNLETEQKFKDARDVELQKFLHHVQDQSTAAEGLVSGKIVTPSQPESYKYQAFTVADGTPMVDKRHLQEDDIGKLQRKSAGDDWNDYVQRRKESLDKEEKRHRDEVAKKNSDAIEAIKSMGIPQVITEHAPRRPSPILYELPHFDIQVAKHTLPDDDLDFDLDFDDDSTHITNETPTDFVDPPFPAISFNIPPPGPEQPLPPPEDFSPDIISRPDLKMCIAPWMNQTKTGDSPDIPETELFPSQAPRTVRDMLTWLAGLRNPKHHDTLKQCIKRAFGGLHDDPSQLALSVNGSYVRPTDVFDILQLTAMFAGSVLTAIAPNWRASVATRTVQPKSSDEPDCCALLCQLRDYVYACCHQLQFLKSQCSRDKLSGGWQDCGYGSDITASKSPLQAFLTDGWDSDFDTHPFDPCNLCHKSRVRMGFQANDLPKSSQQGSAISSILTPSCGGDDPLLTLCSYLNCLTRRTPRTTGELVSFFHHFGIELHDFDQSKLSKLGTSLCNPHPDCPDWDRLKNSSLHAVKGIRGTEALISKHNSNHNNEHPRTLSTLVGCSSATANCPQHCSPITYRAYALYSQSFAHTYLSWTVYLPDSLRESLEKL